MAATYFYRNGSHRIERNGRFLDAGFSVGEIKSPVECSRSSLDLGMAAARNDIGGIRSALAKGGSSMASEFRYILPIHRPYGGTDFYQAHAVAALGGALDALLYLRDATELKVEDDWGVIGAAIEAGHDHILEWARATTEKPKEFAEAEDIFRWRRHLSDFR